MTTPPSHFQDLDFFAGSNDWETCTNKQKRKRKCVSFSTFFDEVVEIPGLEDFTKEKISNLWMSEDEVSASVSQCFSLAGVMQEKHNGISWRGLDQNTPKYLQTQLATRRQAYDSVAAIQNFQRTTGAAVCDLTADVLRKLSAPSVAAAQDYGDSDARLAKRLRYSSS
jgi:hypothetical protein